MLPAVFVIVCVCIGAEKVGASRYLRPSKDESSTTTTLVWNDFLHKRICFFTRKRSCEHQASWLKKLQKSATQNSHSQIGDAFTFTIDTMPAASGSDFSSLLASLPLRSALLTDQEGVVLLRTAPAAADELDLQRMAATFAQTAEHAGKLGMGKNRHATAFYGAQDCAVAPPSLAPP
jgi:hypothetical protein